MKVTKESIIAEVLSLDPEIVPILKEAGLHCLGCPSATSESLEEAAMVHGFDVNELVAKINNLLENK